MTSKRKNMLAAVAAAVLAGTVFLGARPALAQEETETPGAMRPGAEEYRISCQVCHGADGKGNGPMAKHLLVKPSDLTVLAKNNEGKFPLQDVFQIIDGRTMVRGHGERTMPVWGSRFSVQAEGAFGPYGGEVVVRNRILELVFYIQELQE